MAQHCAHPAAAVMSASWPYRRAWQRLLALCLNIALLLAATPTGSYVPTTPCHFGSFSGPPLAVVPKTHSHCSKRGFIEPHRLIELETEFQRNDVTYPRFPG